MADVPPELSALVAQSLQRSQYQNPLFQAASNQAFQGLPTYARQGLSMGSSLPPISLSGGGGSGLQTAAAAALPLSALISGLVKLFAHHGLLNAGQSALANPNTFVGPQQPATAATGNGADLFGTGGGGPSGNAFFSDFGQWIGGGGDGSGTDQQRMKPDPLNEGGDPISSVR